MLRSDHRPYAPTNVEGTRDAEPSRRTSGDQIVENLIGDRLVKVPLLAEGPEIEFERLELDTELIGNVFNVNAREVGLTRLGADTRELRAIEVDRVFSARVGIWECLEFAGRLRAQLPALLAGFEVGREVGFSVDFPGLDAPDVAFS